MLDELGEHCRVGDVVSTFDAGGIYFPETYRSIRENPRFRTHFLTLNPVFLSASFLYPGALVGWAPQ